MLSGFYEGQWTLLGNQTNLFIDESKWNKADGMQKHPINTTDELERLGRNSLSQYNYTAGKVEFALQFDPVFQDTMADSIIDNIQSSIKESQDQQTK